MYVNLLSFNNLTIIFQVPPLLLWQCPGPPSLILLHPFWLRVTNLWWLYALLLFFRVSENLPWSE